MQKTSLIISLMTSLVLFGCGGGGSTKEEPPQNPPSSSGGATNVDEYIGVWHKVGYGLYLDIQQDQVIRYEASDESCIQTHEFERTDFPNKLSWTVTEVTDENMAYFEYGNESLTYSVSKTVELPASCTKPLNNTPTNVLNHLVAMADKYYAFFEQRNIDWSNAKDKALADVHDGMTDAELKRSLFELMTVFDDRHVLLHSAEIDLLVPEFNFDEVNIFGKANDFESQLRSEYENLSLSVTFEEYYYYQLFGYFTIINEMMDEGLKMKGGVDGNAVMWGTINNEVGYIHIGELDFFDPNHAEQFTDTFHKAHLAGLNQVLDEVVLDLQHTSGIILDLRMHSGGTTQLDRAVAQRFIEQDITYGSYFAPDGPIRELKLSPYDGDRFTQQTVVITSNFVQSSGEDMVMALKAEGDVVQIGETTLGTLSDMLFLSLPNQWAFSLSNETWLDVNGDSLEAVGIAPEFSVPVFPLTDRQENKNSAIDKALELLRQ